MPNAKATRAAKGADAAARLADAMGALLLLRALPSWRDVATLACVCSATREAVASSEHGAPLRAVRELAERWSIAPGCLHTFGERVWYHRQPWAGALHDARHPARVVAVRDILALAAPRPDLAWDGPAVACPYGMSSRAYSTRGAQLGHRPCIELCGCSLVSYGEGCMVSWHVLCVRSGEPHGKQLAIELAAFAGGEWAHDDATMQSAELKARVRDPLAAVGVDAATLDDRMLVFVLLCALSATERGRGIPNGRDPGTLAETWAEKAWERDGSPADGVVRDGVMANFDIGRSRRSSFRMPWSVDPDVPQTWPLHEAI